MSILRPRLWKSAIAYFFLKGNSFPPKNLSFNMINKCNLKCQFCWQFKDGGIFSSEKSLDSETLSLEELRRIIDEVCIFRPGITIWGGEPFLSPHTMSFAHYIKRQGLFLNIITNGTLIASNAKQLVEMNLDSLMISLDGPREVHDSIRGVKGTFDQVLMGLKEVIKEKHKAASQKPVVKINFTFSLLNQSNLIDFLEDLGELRKEIGEFFLSQLWFTTASLGAKYGKLTRELFGEELSGWQGLVQDTTGMNADCIYNQIEEFNQRKEPFKKILLPSLTRNRLEKYYREPENNLGYHRCLVPWSSADIMFNGDVSPCSDRPFYIVGNVKKRGFMEIWNGNRFRNFRKQLRRSKLFPICTRCCLLFDQ